MTSIDSFVELIDGNILPCKAHFQLLDHGANFLRVLATKIVRNEDLNCVSVVLFVLLIALRKCGNIYNFNSHVYNGLVFHFIVFLLNNWIYPTIDLFHFCCRHQCNGNYVNTL